MSEKMQYSRGVKAFGYVFSIMFGMIITLGFFVIIISVNNAYGQEETVSSIFAKSSIFQKVLDARLSFCETVNSNEKYVELMDTCINYLQDFNAKAKELANDNPEFPEAMEKFKEIKNKK